MVTNLVYFRALKITRHVSSLRVNEIEVNCLVSKDLPIIIEVLEPFSYNEGQYNDLELFCFSCLVSCALTMD